MDPVGSLRTSNPGRTRPKVGPKEVDSTSFEALCVCIINRQCSNVLLDQKCNFSLFQCYSAVHSYWTFLVARFSFKNFIGYFKGFRRSPILQERLVGA